MSVPSKIIYVVIDSTAPLCQYLDRVKESILKPLLIGRDYSCKTLFVCMTYGAYPPFCWNAVNTLYEGYSEADCWMGIYTKLGAEGGGLEPTALHEGVAAVLDHFVRHGFAVGTASCLFITAALPMDNSKKTVYSTNHSDLTLDDLLGHMASLNIGCGLIMLPHSINRNVASVFIKHFPQNRDIPTNFESRIPQALYLTLHIMTPERSLYRQQETTQRNSQPRLGHSNDEMQVGGALGISDLIFRPFWLGQLCFRLGHIVNQIDIMLSSDISMQNVEEWPSLLTITSYFPLSSPSVKLAMATGSHVEMTCRDPNQNNEYAFLQSQLLKDQLAGMVKISDKAVLLAMAHAFGIYALFVERKIKPSPEVPLPSNLLQNHRAEHLPYMSEPLTSALNAMEADVSPEKILARRRARSISNRIDQQLSPPMPNSLPSCNNPDIEDEKDDYQDFMLLAFN